MEKLKKNIWNIAGVVGTIATLFFGIYGLVVVPDYIKDAYKERLESANNEIITDLKEILFSTIQIDSLIVPTLKKGKEIKYNISFSKTSREILVEVQESFVSDKFISLGQRILLYEKTDSLKRITPDDKEMTSKDETQKSLFSIFTSILSVISLLISVLLLYGLITKRKQQISEELEKKFEEIQETQPQAISDYLNFEGIVGEAIRQLNLEYEDYTKNPRDFSFDFLIKLKDKNIGVEVKSIIKQETLSLIRKQFDNSRLDALILVTNKTINFATFNVLSDMRKFGIAGRRIYFVSAKDIDKIKTEMTEILKAERK
jgi:hypothetical protein